MALLLGHFQVDVLVQVVEDDDALRVLRAVVLQLLLIVLLLRLDEALAVLGCLVASLAELRRRELIAFDIVEFVVHVYGVHVGPPEE